MKKTNESLADSKNSCTFATAIERESDEINGALVQLVRIHACHAWGHGFESRTHRNNTLNPLKVNHFRGIFFIGLNRETAPLTHYDTWRYIRYYSFT